MQRYFALEYSQKPNNSRKTEMFYLLVKVEIVYSIHKPGHLNSFDTNIRQSFYINVDEIQCNEEEEEEDQSYSSYYCFCSSWWGKVTEKTKAFTLLVSYIIWDVHEYHDLIIQ